jgi:beta-phosphoglucomutase-like phosphatase (HAD superfamily)/dTDP-glucose pyrophosphorylase
MRLGDKLNKLIIFDLDGVLVDTKEMHFEALNYAISLISDKYVISREEQENIYEGLPTKEKLKILTQRKGLSKDQYQNIWNEKQNFTQKILSRLEKDEELIQIFSLIKNENIKIAVASNSIRNTLDICLKSLGIDNLVDYSLSNEDVKNSKPHPEMYWKAMSYFSTIPDHTVIFEDSIVGKLGATNSKAKLVEIDNRSDVSIKKINLAISYLNKTKAKIKNINILIPMAGEGTRFANAGYEFPKPIIDVAGKPMIHRVVDSLAIEGNYVYIVQKSHFEKYNLNSLLNFITPDCTIIQVDGITEGAAVTTLLAKDLIDNELPLIIVNSDQIVRWNSKSFIDDMLIKNLDGSILTFTSTHPKWSYAKIDDSGFVLEVAEKNTISDHASVGIYYWKHGSDYVKYAEQMISNNIRTNNEFYICPVYNEAIKDKKTIQSYDVDKMWGIGTPEDLDYFLNSERFYD